MIVVDIVRDTIASPCNWNDRISAKITCWAKMVGKYFIHYGLPTRIHSDQLIKEMLTTLGVKKSRTHPQGNPQPERFNWTLLDMLGTLEPSQKSKWSQHVTHLVHDCNCTPNKAIGFSPYLLMVGREARLPVDFSFGVSADGTSSASYLKYVKRMKLAQTKRDVIRKFITIA